MQMQSPSNCRESPELIKLVCSLNDPFPRITSRQQFYFDRIIHFIALVVGRQVLTFDIELDFHFSYYSFYDTFTFRVCFFVPNFFE